MDERPAPVVTISDPTRPGQPSDVVVGGHERDPWRPTRRQLRLVALLAVVGLAAALPQWVVTARATDRRTAAAAADAVRLAVYPTSPSPSRGIALQVRNDSPVRLRLQDLRVDGPGYRTEVVGRDLAPAQDVVVPVADSRRCGDDLLEAGASGLVRLRARTQAGREVRRTVTLDPDAWRGLVAAAQRRCGDLPPEAALRATVTTLSEGPRALDLRLRLENHGHAPLRLGFVSVPVADLAAAPTPQLPLVLAAGPDRSVSLRLRLSVQDCQTAIAFVGDPAAVVDEPLLDLNVTSVLAGGRLGPMSEVFVNDRYGVAAVRDLVAARCGPTPAGG